MSWDRKAKGASGGYYYSSKRVPDKPYPVKVYMGRGAAGHEAAAEVERRRQARLDAKEIILAEHEAFSEAEQLAAELYSWTDTLVTAWMVVTGHHRHRGEWRLSRG